MGKQNMFFIEIISIENYVSCTIHLCIQCDDIQSTMIQICENNILKKLTSQPTQIHIYICIFHYISQYNNNDAIN